MDIFEKLKHGETDPETLTLLSRMQSLYTADLYLTGDMLNGQAALSHLHREYIEAVLRCINALKKAERSVEAVDSLAASLDKLKAELDKVSSKLEQQDNTVGLFVSGKGRVISEIDALLKDTDALITDIKKRGLRLNVDIF